MSSKISRFEKFETTLKKWKLNIGHLIIFLIFCSFGALWLFASSVNTVMDWYRLKINTPSEEVESIADSLALTDQGRTLFYASNPRLVAREDTERVCRGSEERKVGGCYIGLYLPGTTIDLSSQIWILDYKDERLDNSEKRIAAHELLHAAYARLPRSEKNRINTLVSEEIYSAENEERLEYITSFYGDDEDTLINEAHSFIGTDELSLSDELEEHYGKYFSDRDVLLDINEEQSQIIDALENKAEELVARINEIREQVLENNAAIEQLNSEVIAIRSRLVELEQSGDFNSYNALIPYHNQLMDQLNRLASSNDSILAEDKELREEFELSQKDWDTLFEIDTP